MDANTSRMEWEMKEYWVNVYKHDYVMGAYYYHRDAIFWGNLLGGGIGYRLHVREFETKEAKELYLKMKYGKIEYRECFSPGLKIKLNDGWQCRA